MVKSLALQAHDDITQRTVNMLLTAHAYVVEQCSETNQKCESVVRTLFESNITRISEQIQQKKITLTGPHKSAIDQINLLVKNQQSLKEAIATARSEKMYDDGPPSFVAIYKGLANAINYDIVQNSETRNSPKRKAIAKLLLDMLELHEKQRESGDAFMTPVNTLKAMMKLFQTVNQLFKTNKFYSVLYTPYISQVVLGWQDYPKESEWTAEITAFNVNELGTSIAGLYQEFADRELDSLKDAIDRQLVSPCDRLLYVIVRRRLYQLAKDVNECLAQSVELVMECYEKIIAGMKIFVEEIFERLNGCDSDPFKYMLIRLKLKWHSNVVKLSADMNSLARTGLCNGSPDFVDSYEDMCLKGSNFSRRHVARAKFNHVDHDGEYSRIMDFFEDERKRKKSARIFNCLCNTMGEEQYQCFVLVIEKYQVTYQGVEDRLIIKSQTVYKFDLLITSSNQQLFHAVHKVIDALTKFYRMINGEPEEAIFGTERSCVTQ